jgi:hypothetical protein
LNKWAREQEAAAKRYLCRKIEIRSVKSQVRSRRLRVPLKKAWCRAVAADVEFVYIEQAIPQGIATDEAAPSGGAGRSNLDTRDHWFE